MSGQRIAPLLDAGGVVLTTVATSILAPPVSPSSAEFEVVLTTIVNDDVATRTYTLYRVPPGGVAGSATLIGPNGCNIATKTVYHRNSPIFLPNGWALWAKADANSVVTLSFDGKINQ